MDAHSDLRCTLMDSPICRGVTPRELTPTTRLATICALRDPEVARPWGGSVRENPARWTSSEVAMWESGQWSDTAYAACTLGGARCKHQVLRHNVEEIQRWPSANCHHVHDPQEWTPYTCDGRRIYPSKEEAEYTAVLAFAIAVSASSWAVRKGLASVASAENANLSLCGAPGALA
jgi:hypothetical protein